MLALSLVVFGALAAGSPRLEPHVDFVDTVPASPSVDAYRALLAELDGTRFVAIHMPAADGQDLRSDAGFDRLVLEQQSLTAFLGNRFPGAFSHSLSAYEAMRAGNHMLQDVLTAGNAPESAYALPSDPVSQSYVRDQVRGPSGADVLAADGQSALALFFFATKDDGQVRQVAGQVADALPDWDRAAGVERATGTPQASGLAVTSQATDERNQDGLRFWGALSGGLAAAAVLVVVRRPGNALVAAAGLVAATAAAFGTAGWLGVEVSFLTVFLAPVVTGIGMDLALHVLRRHDEERRGGKDPATALATALLRQGPALAASAAATTLGLAVLMLLPAPLFAQVGALGALGVGLSLAACLTLVPALRALLPDRPPRPARDAIGAWMQRWGLRVARHPVVSVLVVVALLAVAAAGATRARAASGSADNEFPQDDPAIVLQHRIEAEYGAFQRAYLVLQGDLLDPVALRELHAATLRAADLPLHRDASSVADLLIADAKTDQGLLDIALGQAAPTPDEEQLPATREEAAAAVARLRDDPLWRTLVPFTLSQDARLAVVAIQVHPWESPEQLRALTLALDDQAAALQAALPGHTVHAAGAPLNRQAVADQTPRDVTLAILGTGTVVAASLAFAWVRRGAWGTLVAATGIVVVLGSALLLLASVPALDELYAYGADHWGWARNQAPLTDMFLLAFAVTVAVGADGFVQVCHRAWEERDAGHGRAKAVERALAGVGRQVVGTALTTVAAFAPLVGLYFLQSKNLAILACLGAVYAFVLTILLAPVVAGLGKPRPNSA